MEKEISSSRHPLIQHVRSLLSDSRRREQEGQFIVEGIKIAGEALGSGLVIDEALIAADRREDERFAPILAQLEQRGVPRTFVRGSALSASQDADAPQGISLVVRRPAVSLASTLEAGSESNSRFRCIAVAWQIQDPGNLGAMIRIAEATGTAALLTVRGGVDPYHPRAVRASAGSVLRVPLPMPADPESLPGELVRMQFELAATVPSGGVAYDALVLERPVAFLFGNEGSGLPESILERSASRIRIPVLGKVESLNVAVTAALILFHAAGRRADAPACAGPAAPVQNPSSG